MKDLLDLLTARELESGEDCLRLALLNFNGLAGIYLIQYEHEITRPVLVNNNRTNQYYIHMAIEAYGRVIETAVTYQEHFHADSFQLAHAYYNLSHAISLLTKIDNINADIQRFEKMLKILYIFFLQQFYFSKISSDEAFHEFSKIKERHQTQSEHEMSESWKNYNEKLLEWKDVEKDIKNLLIDISTCIKSIENEKIEIYFHLNRERRLPFTTWKGFLLTLTQEFDKLKQIRENLLIYIEALKRQPTDSDVAKMASCSKCGLDNDSSNENMCIFCECETAMKSYNCR